MKKFLSMLLAAAMAASMAVAPVFADEGDTETPVETPQPTAEPAEPLTPLDVTALPKDVQIKFDDANGATYTEPDTYGDYVAVYAGEYNGEARNITVDGSNKTIGSTKYTTRLKFGGAVVYDADGAPAIRTISVTPAEAGTLVVDFAHASSSGDARTFAAYQNGKEIGSKAVAANATDTLSVNVEAGTPVYLYSKTSGINVYGIILTEQSEDDPGEATPEPGDLEIAPLPIGTKISFEAYEGKEIAVDEKIGEYLIAHVNGSTISIDGSNKTIGDTKYSHRLKFGGTSNFSKMNRVLEVKPAAAGTLSVDFAHSSSSGDARQLIVNQSGSDIATKDVAADGTETLSVAVKANESVYIYCAVGAVNIYGITLAEGGIVDEPTPTPGDATPEPGITGTCVKITATYADGILDDVSIEEISAADIDEPVTEGDVKVLYWDSVKGMKPVTNADYEQPVVTATPAPTKAPESDWDWEASEAALENKKGTELMPGLTQLFDNVSTNKAYIAGADNGEYDETLHDNPSMLKYVPTKDGILTVKINGLGAGKSVEICEIGTQKDASTVTNEGDASADVTVWRYVEAGKSYYVTGKGTKARFSAAKFTEQAVPKSYSWAASEDSIGTMPKGTELFAGLTTLFDNVSTNKAYIAGADNGEWDEETSENPSMLKFVATVDGVLTVLIKDVEKTAVIVEQGTKEDASAVTPDSKQDVTVTRNVEAGKTYYVTVKGSKARFVSASFVSSVN